jgi:Ca2+-binding EF-hand superfamily protein
MKLKIHGFSSFCSSILDLEIEERNINSLFLTIDKDKNGHIDQAEFITTVEMISPDGNIKN